MHDAPFLSDGAAYPRFALRQYDGTSHIIPFALIRLHVLVEGQTEESFVNEVLAAELAARDIFADAHRNTTGRRHGRLYRGSRAVRLSCEKDNCFLLTQRR